MRQLYSTFNNSAPTIYRGHSSSPIYYPSSKIMTKIDLFYPRQRSKFMAFVKTELLTVYLLEKLSNTKSEKCQNFTRCPSSFLLYSSDFLNSLNFEMLEFCEIFRVTEILSSKYTKIFGFSAVRLNKITSNRSVHKAFSIILI